MNYLAHLYLSGEQTEVMAGNFFADDVKGKAYLNFAPGLQKGMMLHRHIDNFTDSHPINYAAREKLHPYCHKYSSVALDMIYDHYLAREWKNYAAVDLGSFTVNCYRRIAPFASLFSPKMQHLFAAMSSQNWLIGYAKKEGLERSLAGLSKRAVNAKDLPHAMNALETHGRFFERQFRDFFPLLVSSCSEFRNQYRLTT